MGFVFFIFSILLIYFIWKVTGKILSALGVEKKIHWSLKFVVFVLVGQIFFASIFAAGISIVYLSADDDEKAEIIELMRSFSNPQETIRRLKNEKQI